MSMPVTVVRPSLKLIIPYYWLAGITAAVILVYRATSEQPLEFLLIAPGVLALWALSRHIQSRFITLTVSEGRLRYQEGILSRSTRTMDLAKVQDVRVNQSLIQRMLGTGDVTLETAGETGRLTIANVDRPHDVADRVLQAVRQHDGT